MSEDRDELIRRAVEAFAALIARRSDVCPHCGQHVTALEQVGRSVYARPCGCRQYQGTVPEAWKE